MKGAIQQLLIVLEGRSFNDFFEYVTHIDRTLAGLEQGARTHARNQGGQSSSTSFHPKEAWARSVLGIAADADFDTARARYRKLAKDNHPDTGNVSDHSKIQEINQAWEVMKDVYKKAA
jgi:DnaJ-domain-containing protein 1